MEGIRKALNKTSQFMQKLAQAGLTEELMNNIINSPDNEMAETMVSSLSGRSQPKNKFLTQIHIDKTAIVHKMYGPDACFEEIFGSLCGHIKKEETNGIPALIEKLKENNLLFSSKETGVNYIKSGVKSGIHNKGFTYFFAYLDEDVNIFVSRVEVGSGGSVYVCVGGLSDDCEWSAGRELRVVVPTTKTLEPKS